MRTNTRSEGRLSISTSNFWHVDVANTSASNVVQLLNLRGGRWRHSWRHGRAAWSRRRRRRRHWSRTKDACRHIVVNLKNEFVLMLVVDSSYQHVNVHSNRLATESRLPHSSRCERAESNEMPAPIADDRALLSNRCQSKTRQTARDRNSPMTAALVEPTRDDLSETALSLPRDELSAAATTLASVMPKKHNITANI